MPNCKHKLDKYALFSGVRNSEAISVKRLPEQTAVFDPSARVPTCEKATYLFAANLSSFDDVVHLGCDQRSEKKTLLSPSSGLKVNILSMFPQNVGVYLWVYMGHNSEKEHLRISRSRENLKSPFPVLFCLRVWTHFFHNSSFSCLILLSSYTRVSGCRRHLYFISRHKLYGRNNRCAA